MDNQHSLEWELIEMLKSVIHRLIVAITIITILFCSSVVAFLWYINQHNNISTITASTDRNGAILILPKKVEENDDGEGTCSQ